jgi:hypothetical protein
MKVMVDIDDAKLNKSSQGIIKKLNEEKNRLISRNITLETRIHTMQAQIDRANLIVRAVKQAGKFTDDDDFNE